MNRLLTKENTEKQKKELLGKYVNQLAYSRVQSAQQRCKNLTKNMHAI